MSDDLIKRSDAIKATDECFALLARLRVTARKALEAVPSADRPQGEWITVWDEYGENENGYKCSECGAEVDEKFPNCPYCLARMKGADDEA